MRIAHVVSTFPPYHGGMGNVANELAQRSAARGHEVVVVTPRRGIRNQKSGIMGRDQSHNSSFIIHDSRPWLRFGNAAWCPGIRRTLEQLQPNIVHLHWPFIGGIAPALSWRQHDGAQRRRLVVQYHMDLLAGGWKGALFRWYERRTLPWALQFADRVVVSSRDYAAHGALASHVERLGDRLVEIPFGVDVERFASRSLPPAPPLPRRGGEAKKNFSPSSLEGEREGEGFHVLFVGGLDRAHAFKGVAVLLEAMAKTKKGPGPFSLRIVGDGDLRPAYERQMHELGIADRVEFLESVPDSDLPGIYQSADVLVLPSTARSEAFGIVLLEAMASGIPVIASNLPGVRTVIVDGQTGFLVPPGDAAALAARIAELARDPARARTMGAAARRRVEERYTWDRVMDAWDRCDRSV